MKVVIVGCGRVGAMTAELLDAGGHEVVIIDLLTRGFDRLTSGFKGNAVRGDGTDEDVLRRAGAAGADVFLALTEGDNRNVMAAQLAAEVFGIAKVVAKINDPVRAEAYASLGIATLCRTNLMADAVFDYMGMPKLHLPGVIAPTGHHPGGEHHVAAEEGIASDGGARGQGPEPGQAAASPSAGVGGSAFARSAGPRREG